MVNGFNAELRLMMMVLYDRGMRTSPIVNLEVRMIREDGGSLH
jgi:site-specific recombinase XerD